MWPMIASVTARIRRRGQGLDVGTCTDAEGERWIMLPDGRTVPLTDANLARSRTVQQLESEGEVRPSGDHQPRAMNRWTSLLGQECM